MNEELKPVVEEVEEVVDIEKLKRELNYVRNDNAVLKEAIVRKTLKELGLYE